MTAYGAGFTGPRFEIKEIVCMTVKEQVRLSAIYGRIDAALAELGRVKTPTDEVVAKKLRLSVKHLEEARAYIQGLDESIPRPRVR
jgi:hypothetical protein